jgi:hypothetical protein
MLANGGSMLSVGWFPLPCWVFQFSSGLMLQPWPAVYTLSAFFGSSARVATLDVLAGVGANAPVVLCHLATVT